MPERTTSFRRIRRSLFSPKDRTSTTTTLAKPLPPTPSLTPTKATPSPPPAYSQTSQSQTPTIYEKPPIKPPPVEDHPAFASPSSRHSSSASRPSSRTSTTSTASSASSVSSAHSFQGLGPAPPKKRLPLSTSLTFTMAPTQSLYPSPSPLCRSSVSSPTGDLISQPFPLDPSITVHSVPQFLWTQNQCHTWLYQIFTTYLSNSPSAAFEKARKFEGFGPNIFSTTYVGWKILYGTWEGDGIFGLVFVRRNEDGAMPKCMTYGHFDGGRKENEEDKQVETEKEDREDINSIEGNGRVDKKVDRDITVKEQEYDSDDEECEFF